MTARLKLKIIVKSFAVSLIILILNLNIAYAERLKIICSMYPVYDLALNIAGGNADVELLIKPGTEPHDFEPSPRDIKNLNQADIFIFSGLNMESWAEKISAVLNKNILIVDASQNIKLINNDPHVWLDLLNAAKMCGNILNALCVKDFNNAESYKLNADNYINKLLELDKNFESLINNKVLAIGGPFAYRYFFERYKNFNYISAYDGESEPGFAQIAGVIKFVKENNIKYIFYDALESDVIAKSIASQTGAELLLLNSAHNISLKDFEDKLSFYEIMRNNLENIKLAVR
ncbi:MAG: zinc ABC transporter substrate-binding protein [Synergistaceae bacterium]|nr:zinc ABC transporter substrate-binding protein [Synergistaceae bacterium]